jgi:hypothetical protein
MARAAKDAARVLPANAGIEVGRPDIPKGHRRVEK